jgi:hypothetical protein
MRFFWSTGTPDGKAMPSSDWLEAEREIRRQRIPVRARILHFAELPLKLSGFKPRSPDLAHIRNPIRQPA